MVILRLSRSFQVDVMCLLCNHCVVVIWAFVWLSFGCCVVIMWFLCGCRLIVVWLYQPLLSCGCRVVVHGLSCCCHVGVVWLSCGCHVVVMWLSCGCQVSSRVGVRLVLEWLLGLLFWLRGSCQN